MSGNKMLVYIVFHSGLHDVVSLCRFMREVNAKPSHTKASSHFSGHDDGGGSGHDANITSTWS